LDARGRRPPSARHWQGSFANIRNIVSFKVAAQNILVRAAE